MVQKMGFNRTENSAGSRISRSPLQAAQTSRPVLFGTPKRLPPSTPPSSSRKLKRSTPPIAQEDAASDLEDNGEAQPSPSLVPAPKKPRLLKSSPSNTSRATAVLSTLQRLSSVDTTDITSDALETEYLQDDSYIRGGSSFSKGSPSRAGRISRPSKKVLGTA